MEKLFTCSWLGVGWNHLYKNVFIITTQTIRGVKLILHHVHMQPTLILSRQHQVGRGEYVAGCGLQGGWDTLELHQPITSPLLKNVLGHALLFCVWLAAEKLRPSVREKSNQIMKCRNCNYVVHHSCHTVRFSLSASYYVSWNPLFFPESPVCQLKLFVGGFLASRTSFVAVLAEMFVSITTEFFHFFVWTLLIDAVNCLDIIFPVS